MANVIKRFCPEEALLRQLRTILRHYAGANKDSVQWRITHSLGAFPDQRNVDSLFRVLNDCDVYFWAKYGSARSLVEIAARSSDDSLQSRVFEGLIKSADSLPRAVLEEMARALLIDLHPGSWKSHGLHLLEKIRSLPVCQPDREAWDQSLSEFQRFCEEREPSDQEEG